MSTDKQKLIDEIMLELDKAEELAEQMFVNLTELSKNPKAYKLRLHNNQNSKSE